jgi:hypothetical protein
LLERHRQALRDPDELRRIGIHQLRRGHVIEAVPRLLDGTAPRRPSAGRGQRHEDVVGLAISGVPEQLEPTVPAATDDVVRAPAGDDHRVLRAHLRGPHRHDAQRRFMTPPVP